MHIFDRTLEWLDAVKPDDPWQFNMEKFRFHHDCGTVMCIAGALSYFEGIEAVDPEEVGEKIGLTFEQADQLFYARPTPDHRLGSYLPNTVITPAIAAATIRRFIATGEISWQSRS